MLVEILFGSGGNFMINLVIFLFVAAALVISISIHEFAHAFAATKLGDPTAKAFGRVTLNPKAHLDPVGTVLLLIFGFGWGKPVPFNPQNLKNPKRDSALISFAGPLSNILLASLFAGMFHFLGLSMESILGVFVLLTVQFNLILAIFNMIPVHPLDGFKVVNGLLPEELSHQWLQLGRYGMWILLLLIFTDVTDKIILPTLAFFMRILGF